MGNGYGTTALIFGSFCIPVSAAMAAIGSIFNVGGIFSLPPTIVSLLTIISWLIPGIAIIFGIVGIVVDDSKGKAIAGLVLGLIGLIAGIVIRVIIEDFFASLIP